MRIRGAETGAVIVDVEPASPAARVGFQPGDVVLERCRARTWRAPSSLPSWPRRGGRALADQLQPRRPGLQHRDRGMSNLFEAAGLADVGAAAARRPAPAGAALGGRRAGPPARPGRHADAHAEDAERRLARLLGTAGHRQDHGRAASRRGDRPPFPADLRHPFRRRRAEEDLRRGARAPAGGAGDAALRRRDPSLQPRAAGFLPAGDGGRHRHAGRRDDREPVLRAERRASLARDRARLQVARRARRWRRCSSAPRRRRAGSCRSTTRRAAC